MATIVLQAAGAFLGGVLGPVGAAIGTAAGAIAGYAVDRALLGGTQHYHGPRLSAPRPFSAEEGASLPRIYGTMRTGGTLIWATRFEERSSTSRQGGKGGGPKTTTYSYFANAAFAVCEGEIAGIRRIWADGREIDREQVEIRVYTGSETQSVDPLIEAKQGPDNAPAYRGTAYVVIDRLPIDEYGRRLPQFQFEVLRPVGQLHKDIRAVSLIPGATEYGLSPSRVALRASPGEKEDLNRHTLVAGSDFEASLDELQMLCPNLETVALVVAWFGTDLRAGDCQIRPMVTHRITSDYPFLDLFEGEDGMLGAVYQQLAGLGVSSEWKVSGIDRDTAQIVSQTDDGAAYGGTPSDNSVMEAIAAIRQRGLKVWLYPFVMMDVPQDNALPDPYGGAAQAPYPWRGRITCHPAPGVAGSVNKSAAARTQLEALAGNAAASDFASASETVHFNGAADDWGYKRFLLHYAHLAANAGGVDGFLIGSELRGLTCVRDGGNGFPFVETLQDLAGDARAILGSQTTITYGADWTEYFGHQPADGSGDVFFHLDPLWAHPAIDAVGIDNYMPLSDWRDADYGGGNPDGFASPYDPEGLKASIASGEGFDWYYASEAARRARERAPITDGAYGKPWVFRYKDIAGWWSNPHHDRIGGIEAGAPTVWVPQSKPVIFTELGCAAVDKGPNQPNVFPDPKSSENATPYFSNGCRSDLAQSRFLAAHYAYWSGGGAANPVSSVYGGPMVDMARCFVWAWDARPFPEFPLRNDVWGDGANWASGHWLNGRISSVTAGDLINAILEDHGLPPANATAADGMVDGYIIADPTTARAAIEPITDLFGIGVSQEGDGLVLATLGAGADGATMIADLVLDGEAPAIERTREAENTLPAEIQVDFRNQMNDHQSATAAAFHTGAKGTAKSFLSFPGALATNEARPQAAAWLRRRWASREQVRFSAPLAAVAVTPGTLVRLPDAPDGPSYVVSEVEDGLFRTFRARRVLRTPPTASGVEEPERPPVRGGTASRPFAMLLDLPVFSDTSVPQDRLCAAVRANPWRAQAVYASPEETGFSFRRTLESRATMGFLAEAVFGGFEGRLDRAASIVVELLDGELESISPAQLLNGGNVAAIVSSAGIWEVFQFQRAEEISPSLWRVSGLLRGQAGTNDAMAAGAPEGAPFVLLDRAVQPAGLAASEIGLDLNWKFGPVGYDLSAENFVSLTGRGGERALTPFSPVHLRAKRTSVQDIVFSWVRRGRVGADTWQGEDVPLGEAAERYLIEVAPQGGETVRSATVSTPNWTYSAAALAEDFASPPSALDVTVCQISAEVGPGVAARRRFTIT